MTETRQHTLNRVCLEEIVSAQNLRKAHKRVVANKGAAGIDGMEVSELAAYIRQHPGQLKGSLEDGSYRPQPVKRVYIPKDNGTMRGLGIPTAIDRMVQQAVAQVIERVYEPEFSEHSYGFRPNRSAHDALQKVLEVANEGYVWVVDIDLAKFFDTVPQQRLIDRLGWVLGDGRVVSLIHRMMRAGAVEPDGQKVKTEVGVPQGGPLSPLLANIYLDELDKELERRGHRFVRYADDLMILCRSQRAAQRTLESTARFIEQRMKLKVNREKSGVRRLGPTVKYLGHGFYQGKGGQFKLSVHKKSKGKLKSELRRVLSRNRRGSFAWVRQVLQWKLRGWKNYFRHADFKTWGNQLDGWIRHRIRQLIWKTWKRVRTRHRYLKRLGIDEEKAWQWANTRKGYWRTAGSPILHRALGNDRLAERGWTWLALV